MDDVFNIRIEDTSTKELAEKIFTGMISKCKYLRAEDGSTGLTEGDKKNIIGLVKVSLECAKLFRAFYVLQKEQE